MKSKELIEELQKLDPSGEIEVVVGGEAIYFVDHQPGYYDGAYEVLTRDPSKKCFNITKIKRTRQGSKLKIRTFSAENLIWDGFDIQSGGKVEIDNSEFGPYPNYYDKIDEDTRQEVKEVMKTINVDNTKL